MPGLVVAGDGMRPTMELRSVVTDICGNLIGVQQKWISGDATYEEWRWLPTITDSVEQREAFLRASSG